MPPTYTRAESIRFTAISHERLLSAEDGTGRLRVHGHVPSGKRTITLPGQEFIGRFLRHVLPPGFERIRHFGLLASGHKRERLAAARAALDAPQPDPAGVESVAGFLRRIDRLAALRCPHCGGRFEPVQTLPPARTIVPARGPP
jgi:hypothetical protein